MSFRARLTSFFALIVVVPMAAVGFLVFRLIDDSQTGKSLARASGISSTAASMYQSASRQASLDARTLGGDIAFTPVSKLSGTVALIAKRSGLVRVIVKIGNAPTVDVGSPIAIAPGYAVVHVPGGQPPRTVGVSEVTAPQLGAEIAGSGTEVVIRSGAVTLSSTLAAADHVALPVQHGTVTIDGNKYSVVTQTFGGFGGQPVSVSVLSSFSAAGGSVATDRLLAALFIAGFLVLAFFFSLLASRALHGQVGSFLEAARRLGSGDFSSPVPTQGRDEFAQLGDEFNNMSLQLARRLDELEQERARVRKANRRIGEAFASGLDREALLELTLRTAIDATSAERGRLSARSSTVEPLVEVLHVGRLAGLEEPIHFAERRALGTDTVGEAASGEDYLASVSLGPIVPGGPTHGLLTVCRSKRPFTEDDIELLRSLASRASLALANVNLHYDIRRQAVTDDLTGLATHGHFQDLLASELEEARRYRYPVALIMLDLDDFKVINDMHGHQQGDLVLRYVADALRETSRDVDVAARYGGEEMALILPHTDLEGAGETAERLRTAIAGLVVPRLDGRGTLRITASVGAAASSDASKDELIAAADGALYLAKREGKNRSVKATSATANVVGGE